MSLKGEVHGAAALPRAGTSKRARTFLMHQQLQLVFNGFVPLGDVHVQRVVATRLLICRLLPAFKRLQQAHPWLGGHVVDWKGGRGQQLRRKHTDRWIDR